jgi:hypothetical protein
MKHLIKKQEMKILQDPTYGSWILGERCESQQSQNSLISRCVTEYDSG